MANSERSDPFLSAITRPRQVRIAFLIDSDATPDGLLNPVFEFCSRVWGGRLFPIIPVVNGAISGAYWKLLEAVDPDCIYSYTAVSDELMDRLIADVAPLRVLKHVERGVMGENYHLYPSLPDRPISVYELLPQITQQRWFRAPKLAVYSGKQEADALIKRNFGILRESISDPIPDDIERLTFDDSVDFAGFLELAAAHRGGLIYPFSATCLRAVCQAGVESNWSTYAIFIGDRLSDWVSFWNHIFSVRPHLRSDWRALCIPVAVMSDSRTVEALAKFLHRYAYGDGQTPPEINWISSTRSEEELRDLAGPLISKRMNAIHRFSIVDDLHFPEGAQRERVWPGFGEGTFSTTTHQIPRSGGFIDLTPLPFRAADDNHWMQDVYIEYRSDDPYFVNDSLWYQLPRKREIAKGFCDILGRIEADGLLSVEMQPRQSLFIRTPDDHELIGTAIGGRYQIGYTGNFESKDVPPAFDFQQPSDKAKYAKGVLALFGGLHSAHRMFENRFWLRTMSRLATIDTEQSGGQESILFQSIAKSPKQWTINSQADLIEEIRRIEALVTKLARQIRSAERETTYHLLEEDFRKEREEAIIKDPHLAPPDEETGKKDWIEAKSLLKGVLQELVNSTIFLQGLVTHCPACGSRIFRELNHIKQKFECPGCGATAHSPAEGKWYYRLNSLVGRAVAEHGTVALINALAKAREKARACFIYIPGLEFYKAFEDKAPTTEVDAICIVDGKLWIGEVKSRVRDFTDRELEKLARDVRSLRGDVAFVYAQEGDQTRLNARCKSFFAAKGVLWVHLYPSGRTNEPAFHL